MDRVYTQRKLVEKLLSSLGHSDSDIQNTYKVEINGVEIPMSNGEPAIISVEKTVPIESKS